MSSSVTLFPPILDAAERSLLTHWALDQRAKGHLRYNGGPERAFGQWRTLNEIPPLFFEVRQRITEQILKVPDIEDPVLTSYVSVVTNGGSVHLHKDVKEPPGFIHVRCNVLVQSPEEGGMPIVEGQRYQIEEGGGWWFYPSRMWHTSEEVNGSRARVNISFGYLVVGDGVPGGPPAPARGD